MDMIDRIVYLFLAVLLVVSALTVLGFMVEAWARFGEKKAWCYRVTCTYDQYKGKLSSRFAHLNLAFDSQPDVFGITTEVKRVLQSMPSTGLGQDWNEPIILLSVVEMDEKEFKKFYRR